MKNLMVFFSGFKKGFKDFSHVVVNAINFFLLFFVYFIGVGITSLIAKAFGKHFLDIKKRNVNSYWSPLNLGKKPQEEYYRQF
jgi:hypothetical protein